MKKRLICAALSCLMFAGQLQAMAAFPPIKYASGEEVGFSLNNVTDVGTISAKNASFSIEFNPKTHDKSEYVVTYVLDGEKSETSVVSIQPGGTTVKSFGLNVKNGIHELEVTVSQDGTVLSDTKQTIYVMDLYSHQFMEELSGRGVNVHFGWDSWTHNQKQNLDMMYYGGYRVVRSGMPSWSSIEKTKKNYSFSEMNKHLSWLNSKHMRSYDLMNYGNGVLYPSERGMNGTEPWPTWEKTQPQTQDSIWGFANFVLAAAQNDPDPFGYELWNEPNHYTLDTNFKAQIYADFVKPTSVLLDYNGYDKIDLAPYSLAYNDELNFVDTTLRYGMYPYFGSVAHHPYVWEDGFTASRFQEERMAQIENIILKYGGWKDREITEIGYPTTPASNTPSEESASVDIVKTYIVSEAHDNEVTLFYDFVDDGTDPLNNEHNFGQITYDGKPKKPYMTTAAFNLKTEGGIYVGEIDPGIDRATRAFLYLKDGKPVVIAWSNQMDGSAVEWNLGDEKATVSDVFGNITAQDASSVMLEEAPIYIENLSDSWYARAVHDEVAQRDADWLTAYASNLSDEDRAEIKQLMSSAEKSFTGTPSSDEVMKQLENMRDFGLKIISYADGDKLPEVEISKMLYELFRIMQRIDNLYVCVYDGEVPEKLTTRVDDTYNKAHESYLDNLQAKQYCDEMMRHALRYNKNANTVIGLEENPSKAGVIKGWNVIADLLCDWYDAFSVYETTIETGMLIQTPYYDRNSYINTDTTMEVNLNNYSHREFNGTIKIFDEDGTVVSESDQIKLSGEGGYKQIFMTVNTKRPTDDSGFRHYNISYVDNDGNVMASQPTDIKVKDKFQAEVLPATQTVDNLDKISIKVDNLTDNKATAHIKMTSDENYNLVSNNIDVEVDGLGSEIVDVPIANIRDTKYHFYSLKYEVTDDDGNVVASNDTLISFTTVTTAKEKLDIENWDGDISDWSDAYPIYVNAPKNVDKAESWNGAECSTRAFVKWDSEHLYVLADVYDELFLQEFNGTNMWQGDCIQLSIDPLNDGKNDGGGYRSDDYELGFSYTAKGHEFFAWTSPAQLPSGIVDWFKVVRNNDLKITRYLISIDKSIIGNLDLTEGNVLGMNLAINDADILGRENFYQFTLGTADSKNPDYYADFTLSSSEPKDVVDGIAETLFPSKLEASEIAFDNGFVDIEDHWAKSTIEAMHKNGIVNGVDEQHFVPDALITRAEFFQMLSNLSGYDEAEYNGAFEDVQDNDWYASAVQTLSSNSLLPGNMIEDGKILPEKEITREEAVYLATNLCYIEKMKKVFWYDWGELRSCLEFPDGEQVSEWVRPMFDIAVTKEFVVGGDGGNLFPKNTITRAEAAAVLERIIPYMQ